MPTKKVTMWSAELGKKINRSATHPDENVVNQMIDEMKSAQRIANAEYKKYARAKALADLRSPRPLPISESFKEIAPVPFKGIQIQSDIDLKLDPHTGNSTIIFGSGKRGKTTLMMHLYKKYYENDKDFISTLFSINSHIPLYRTEKKERLLRCGTFDPKAEKYIKLEKHINMKTKNKYKFLNMFDDCIDMKYSRLVNNMILTYRNSNLSTIMCLQYAYLLSKMNRANANNIIIFGANSHEAVIDLIKVFLKPYFLTNEKDMIEFYKHITDDHGFFYIHNATDQISFHRLEKIAF